MDSLEFILIVAVFAVVIHWYLKNAETGGGGHAGLLALADDPEEAKAGAERAYRVKPRAADRKPAMRDLRAEQARAATYRVKGEEETRAARVLQRYRRQDEARYRVKDRAAQFKPRNRP